MTSQKRLPATLSVAKLSIDASLQAGLERCIKTASNRQRRNVIVESSCDNRVDIGLVEWNIKEFDDSA
tara:strand:- start:67 stop:270 length:204 start_codon:yes stop_codon:yes gene_type:complete